jgi:hypothetical protein
MPIAKRILITAESRELLIIRRVDNRLLTAFCAICSGEVSFITLDEAVEYAQVPTWELIRKLLLDEIHYLETGSGQILVCRGSLELMKGSNK